MALCRVYVAETFALVTHIGTGRAATVGQEDAADGSKTALRRHSFDLVDVALPAKA